MLTVYRASAGSGKTFTLTVRYLTLLIDNPQSYRSILAVTFTNKATEEMKQRILSQLYGLWRQLPESDRYAREVGKATGMEKAQMARRAGMALTAMLHHYGLFRVETIDAFFQEVLRGVGRELGLTGNWRLGLNDEEIEEAAVDQLVEDLADDTQLRRWVMAFIMERMQDDRSWNVIGQLKEFGQNIFTDFYKSESEALQQVLQQEGFFESYTKELRALSANAQKEMRQTATDFEADMQARGLSYADLYRGTQGFGAYMRKLQSDKPGEAAANSYVLQCLSQTPGWASTKTKNTEQVEALAEAWAERIEQSQKLPAVIRACDATLRHLHLLRLLGRIQQRVNQLNRDSNRLLLSDTQQRLSALIEGSDTPFIYEKTGSRLEHVMIDEFQDTSQAQWQNFRLLLDETMSHRVSHNLIVGDVKQSIYRWRGGNWQLLNRIETQFPNAREQLQQEPLKTNWRSDSRVVRFNNAMFSVARTIETEVGTAYDDVEQLLPADSPDQGAVSVVLLPGSGTEGRSYEETMLDEVLSRVESLLAQGVTPSGIAILVRYNRHLPLLARMLSDRLPQVPVVSDEAFRLDASVALNAVIALLNVLLHPDDSLAQAEAIKMCGNDAAVELLMEKRPTWLALPVAELTEQLLSTFGLDRIEGQSAYLCAFMDAVAALQAERPISVQQLIDEWKSHICAKTVQTDAARGLRLLSIHRSKGLEFDHVLLPFCDWTLESTRTLLWCHVEQQPFARLPLIPVSYSRQQLAGTPFEPFAEEEHRQAVVDNMNLLYVGMTRAIHGLYVIGRRRPAPRQNKSGKPATASKGTDRSWLIEQCLPRLADMLEGSSLRGTDDYEQALTFEWSQTMAAPTKPTGHASNDVQSNPFLARPVPTEVHFTSQQSGSVQFRQSNDSRSFVASDGDDYSEDENGYMHTGQILHYALSLVVTPSDVPAAFRRIEQEGMTGSHHETMRFQHLIEQRLRSPRVAWWFAPGWHVYRECSILVPRPHSTDVADRYRPDRVISDGSRTVVIDYKFGRPNTAYIDQVRRYMLLLTEMGMPAVEGYLWFVYTGDVVPVSLQ